MSKQLIIFVNPMDASATLILDSGEILTGHESTHSSGRIGIGFTIPDNSSNAGSTLVITATSKVTIRQRSILILDSELGYPFLLADDFYLQDVPLPVVIIVPPIGSKPSTNEAPLDVVKRLFPKFDCSTKEGCGKLTEAVVDELHIKDNHYGHVRKFSPQNLYNGHAVDAISLLFDSSDGTKAGVYDLILSSEATDAKPQFIYKGAPDPALWYYPA